jgi:hypothetical protein
MYIFACSAISYIPVASLYQHISGQINFSDISKILLQPLDNSTDVLLQFYSLAHFGVNTMSRLIDEPVKAYQSNDSIIAAFIWRKRLYRVLDVIGWWREPSEWWNGKSIRLFIRVNAQNSSTGTYELYKLGGQWFLSRVLD